MLLVVLCATFIPFAFASINTTCLPAEEVGVLREIGRTLGKDWDFEQDPCVDWSDSIRHRTYENTVTCNLEPNSSICHVVNISLKGQSLPGTLPPELVNLPYLQNLDLTRNYISGTIPRAWGSMQRILSITLRSLTVEDNVMSGIIPDDLGKLTSIERLLLNSNFFTGELPASFANLINMKEFRIGSNNFSGKIPDFIGEWKNLTSLRIQASGLEGPIPPSITLLTNLMDLRISDLRGPDALCPPFKTTSFETVILRSCNLIGELPKSLASTDLVDFSFNKLNGSIPGGFSALNGTDYIYLTGNLLSGIVPDWMLSSGDNIDLSYNNFTHESSRILRCQTRQTNEVSCLGNGFCSTKSYFLYINCGGYRLTVGNVTYESDVEPGGASIPLQQKVDGDLAILVISWMRVHVTVMLFNLLGSQ